MIFQISVNETLMVCLFLFSEQINNGPINKSSLVSPKTTYLEMINITNNDLKY